MDKNEIIRESSIKVIAKYGYYNTSIRMIAEEANVAVGTIYNYFKTKEEIIDYIFEVEHKKRIVFLEKIKNMNLDVFSKINLFLDFHFTELKNNVNVGKVLIQESMIPYNRPIESVQKFLKELPIVFSEILKDGKEKGEIRDIDCEIISSAIFHAIRGVVYSIVTKDRYNDYDNAKKEILMFIRNGIKI